MCKGGKELGVLKAHKENRVVKCDDVGWVGRARSYSDL